MAALDDTVMHEEEEDEELESSNEVLKGHETDSACEEDLLDEEIIEDSNEESIIPLTVLNWADHALARLPPRWRNWITRVISGLSLISGFSFLVSLGPSGLFFLTFLVIFASYNEVLKMGMRLCGVDDMSKWCWTLYFIVHWLVISGDLVQNWDPSVPFLPSLFKYNVAFGFAGYLALLIYFVMTMKDQEYMRKYALFAWCHLWLLFFVVPCHLLNKATMSGIIWYVMPMSIITINDIGAYMVGFFGGKTPLIKMSPKKTKEGFIGGGLITLLLGTVFTYYLMTPYLVCPVQSNPNYLTGLWMYLSGSSSSDYLPLFTVTKCQPSPAFTPSLVSV